MNNFGNQTIEINIDFDGTVVTHEYPRIGRDIGAVEVLKKLVAKGHRLILFTMRCDGNNFKNPDGTLDNHGLTDAVNWFKENGIPLYGVQTNPTQRNWTTSPKSYAPLMIDDSALGCPLKYDYVERPTVTEEEKKVFGDTMKVVSGRPYVDWVKVEKMLIQMGILSEK